VLTDDLLGYVRAALPPPPARILEVGAGDGALAHALAEAGFDVLAIDPDPRGPGVREVALLDLGEAEASFDAAVAVVSLHHVEPLAPSCARLATLLPPGAPFVVDEVDFARVDERAAAWWSAQRTALGRTAPEDPAARVAELRAHLHDVAAIQGALAPGFEVGEAVPGAYLHRWELDPALRPLEEAEIARGALPATGARFVARRRAG
jgi:SAM-dependent methyltransferase